MFQFSMVALCNLAEYKLYSYSLWELLKSELTYLLTLIVNIMMVAKNKYLLTDDNELHSIKKYSKTVCDWGSAPDPAEGPEDPLLDPSLQISSPPLTLWCLLHMRERLNNVSHKLFTKKYCQYG